MDRFVRILLPITSLLALLLGSYLTYDFPEKAQRYPAWAGLYDFTESWIGPAFLCVALLAFFLSMVQSNLRRSHQSLERDLDHAQQRLDVVGLEVRTLFDGIVFNLSTRLGITTGNSRVSIYVHDGAKHFILCGRYSPNPKLNKPGRPSYPDHQGCIARGWENGWWFENDLGKGKAYTSYTIQNYHISREELKQIPMKSALFAVQRLDAAARPVGTIVVESMDRDRFDQQTLKGQLEEAAAYYGPILHALRSYVPDPRTAASRGF